LINNNNNCTKVGAAAPPMRKQLFYIYCKSNTRTLSAYAAE